MSIGGGGGGGSTVKPPTLQQTNIADTENQAIQADTTGYNLSDADWAKRFPDLSAGRQFNIDTSLSNLGAQEDPTISSAEKSAGFQPGMFGGLGGPNAPGAPGGGDWTLFKQAKAMGQPILAPEQRDRSYFQNLLADNPQRQFGLSGADVANIAIGNVAAQNTFNQSLYGTRIAAQNAAILQNSQVLATLYGAGGALGAAGIRSANQPTDPYLNYGSYNQFLNFYGYPTGGGSSGYPTLG